MSYIDDLMADATFTNVQLDHQTFTVCERFVTDYGKFESHRDVVNNDMVYRLSVMIAGQTVVKDITYPATWWDHFKLTFAAWMPIWATDPMMTVVPVRATRLYPEIVPVPGHRTTFVVQREPVTISPRKGSV